jgi:hypothetical protein
MKYKLVILVIMLWGAILALWAAHFSQDPGNEARPSIWQTMTMLFKRGDIR